MVTRAGVTKREFEQEFGSAEDCLVAAFDEGVELLCRTLTNAIQGQWSWLARVRACLGAALELFDCEPGWARLLIVESSSAGTPLLDRRERALARLAGVLARNSPRQKVNGSSALPAALISELVVGGVISVLQNRILRRDLERLSDLTPALMSMIVLPYLGPDAARSELALSPRTSKAGGVQAEQVERLPIRATHRTAVVLQAIAAAPRASNREIAIAAGLTDEGQTSRLLRRLERLGVIENVGLGHAFGERNAWLLTPIGERAAEVSARGLAARTMRIRRTPQGARRACQGDAA